MNNGDYISVRDGQAEAYGFAELWWMAQVVSVGNTLHRYIPKEPRWCQVIGNKVDAAIHRGLRRGRLGAQLLASIPRRDIERLIDVFDAAASRHQDELAKRRLRRAQKQFGRGKVKVVSGGRAPSEEEVTNGEKQQPLS